MIPQTYIDYYGDTVRWFIGHVVDVENDPLKLGRVRVRAYGVYDGVERDEDLPWAQIIAPVTSAIHESKGQNLGILKDTQVFGIFLDGQNSQLPLVIGSIPKEGDTNSKAQENYPHNKVYETETGHFKEYDDTPDNTRIREQHRSGTYSEMQHDGSMRTEVQKDQYIRVIGDSTIVVGSGGENNKANLTIIGDCNITVTGDAKINATNVSVTGTDTVTVRGGNGVRLG